MKSTGSSHRETAAAASLWWVRSKPFLVVAAVALLVAAVLIPSESAVSMGTHVVLVMAWLLLATVVLVRRLADPERSWRVGWTDAAVVLFLTAQGASAMVMLHAGHARLTFNALWLWVAFGMLFFAVRQLFGHPIEQRALVSAVVALAAGLSVFGFYQVGYSDPLTRARYARNPDAALREAGIDAPPGTPQRQQYENRLASKEPIGSFALTNSLAGVLTPSLLLLLFLTASFSRRDDVSRTWVWALGAALPLLVIAACLVLTKSRSAYAATCIGGLLLTASGAVPRRWLRGPVLLATVVVLIVVGAAAVRWGGLDRQVITEASKSLLYRWEYWRATGAMVADYPWFGCGPGNFKSYYTRYKAPEASETIADPHNFLLEIAATTGLPALALFALFLAALAVDLRRRCAGRTSPASDAAGREATGRADTVSPAIIYGGVGAGFVLAYPAGWAGGVPPDFALLWVAGPAVLGTLWLLHAWVRSGSLPSGPLLVAGIALLVNLLAAGGISFPGVGQFVWLFAALLLNAAGAATAHERGGRRLPVLALVVAMLLVGACFMTMYRPVLASRQELDRARAATVPPTARQALVRAAAADPWWGEPWEFLAELESRQWGVDPTERQLAAFLAARDGLLARDRESSRVYRRCGDWLLELFAASGRADLGAEAVLAYTRAVELYPQSGILQAQLAWACHVTGADDEARQHAAEALRLDALMPHTEFKLGRQRLVGDYLAAVTPPAGADQVAESAEQLMQRVRNVKNR